MSTDNNPQTSSSPRPRNKWLLRAGIGLTCLVVVVGLGRWAILRWTHSISKDAFIESHLINVAPQVQGTIVEVFVQEQDLVKRGELLARIDPSTYEREVELAAAKLAVAEAGLEKAEADLTLLVGEVPQRVTIAEKKLAVARDNETQSTESLEMVGRDTSEAVAAAEHAVEAARAASVLGKEDYDRYAALFEDESVSQQRFQEATKVYRATQAELRVAEAKLGQAKANRQQVGIAQQALKAAAHVVEEAAATVDLAKLGDLEIDASRKLVDERRRGVAEARRALELAQINLAYTQVVAPYDGVIARKWRHLGDYAHTGDPVFSMYNSELMYVTVQLEETLLEGVAPGNGAALYVEAYRRPFRGRVLWVGSATSGNFSLIPRDISSGEFTYVVQRVPTRIAIERDERWNLLKPGMSVTAIIEHGSGDPEWAAKAQEQERRIERLGERTP